MPQETGIHRNGFVVLSSRREESFKAIGSQVLLPYLLAGLGMVLAGVVLDRVQVRPTARTYQTSGVSDGTRASNTVLLGVNLCPMRSGNGSEFSLMGDSELGVTCVDSGKRSLCVTWVTGSGGCSALLALTDWIPVQAAPSLTSQTSRMDTGPL
ncbi:solute carrier family 41 member 1-like [Arapaima gigas]